jgi:UDP-glucose 4-epimerase
MCTYLTDGVKVSILLFGGAGFIGRRIVSLLAAAGEEVVCFDINATSSMFEHLRPLVRVIRGDVSKFDEVLEATISASPARILNLAFLLGNQNPPHRAFKINMVGMDNCLEAARLCDIERVVYGSSVTVSGEQARYELRKIDETEELHGQGQYAKHKMFNEWHARDYSEKYGLNVTGVRPAHVTGSDKILGSVDHVQCITNPALGRPVRLGYRDLVRCLVHVDDVAEIFKRVTLADDTKYDIYNSGGHPTSLGELADLVREFIPDASIEFEHELGGKDDSINYLIDNSRLVNEFGLLFRPTRDIVRDIINETRQQAELDPISSETLRRHHVARGSRGIPATEH